jgi:CheY-like chemotaxis protein
MPRLSTVLLLDTDPNGRETLTYWFEDDGIKVSAVLSDAQAVERLRSEQPQVVVVVLHDQDEQNLELVRALGRTAENPAVPLLVLGPAALQAKIQAVGAGAFLPLPAFARDAVTAAKLLAGSIASVGDPDAAELQGALSDYGLFFVVRTMLALGRSGIISVERASRRGEIRVSGGEVVSAQVGPLQGSAALHHLLLWVEAALEIKFRNVARRGQVFKTREDLLEDMERFLRDIAHATKDLGHVQSVFVQDVACAAKAVDTIPVEVIPVLELFDGNRTLGDVLEDSPFRAFDTIRIAVRLLEMGALQRTAVEVPAAAETEGPRLEDWLEERLKDRIIDGSDRVEATGPPEPAPRPEPGETSTVIEQRTGPANRRKAPRKNKGAAELRMSSGGEMNHGPAKGEMALEPAANGGTISGTPKSNEATPGEIQVRGEIRVSKRELPAVASDVPSVMIDLGGHAVSAPAAGSEAPAPLASGEVAPAPSPAVPAAVTGVAAAATTLGASLSGEPPVPPEIATPVSGVLEVSRANRAESNGAPAGSAAVEAPPDLGPSIQIDPGLVADMGALKAPSAPLTPQSTRQTDTEPPPTAAGSNVAMTAAPDASSPAASLATPHTVAPFPLDPAAIGTAPATPEFAPLAPASSVAAPPAEPAASPAEPAASPTSGSSLAADVRGRRPSGEFSALEADFFAREADLYKTEKPESFEDLDLGRRPGPREPKSR